MWLPRKVYDDLIAENRRLRNIILSMAGHGQSVAHEAQIRLAEEATKIPSGTNSGISRRSDVEEAFRERTGRYPDEQERAGLLGYDPDANPLDGPGGDM